jgi:hypothetical protein
MPRTVWLRVALALRLAVVVLCVLAVAGCALLDDLDEALYPTPTAGAAEPMPTAEPISGQPTAIYTLAPSFTWPAPTHTPVPQAIATQPPAPSGAEQGDYNLVYAVGGSVLRGDGLGKDPVEVASVGQLEQWSFAQGLLVAPRGRTLDVIDLGQGTLTSMSANVDTAVDYGQVLLGATGRSILYAASINDATAMHTGRSIELRALAVSDGRELGRGLLHDTTGVQLLRYDDAAQRAWIIPLGDDPSYTELEDLDVSVGKSAQALSIRGEGAAALSPDGKLLVTQFPGGGQGRSELHLYDLTTDGALTPRVWLHPENSHSDSHIWSPDGAKLAFLLRDGVTFDAATKGLGVWVLDVATLEAHQILDESSASSSLIGWSPDGAMLVGYHRGEGEDSHYFAVRPDGGDRQILALPRDAQVIGWMPASKTLAPKVVVDPWRVRFLESADSPESMAFVAAEFSAANIQTPDQALAEQLSGYLAQAGWAMPVHPALRRISDTAFLAQLPDNGIYWLEAGQARLLTRGQVLLDARLDGNDLGLIFGVLSENVVQPSYMLLRRGADGTWQTLWAPQGQRDWVTTDGEVRFAGEGLQSLQVRGSSFGLDLGEAEVFIECRACPHRWLAGTWVREGDGYRRQSQLLPGAALADMYWEMTEPRPYPLVYETLRRLRQALPTDNLASRDATNQANELGLLEPSLRLRPEEETAESVRFTTLDGSTRFVARLQGAQIVAFERVSQ